jgi:hypothetical protein
VIGRVEAFSTLRRKVVSGLARVVRVLSIAGEYADTISSAHSSPRAGRKWRSPRRLAVRQLGQGPCGRSAAVETGGVGLGLGSALLSAGVWSRPQGGPSGRPLRVRVPRLRKRGRALPPASRPALLNCVPGPRSIPPVGLADADRDPTVCERSHEGQLWSRQRTIPHCVSNDAFAPIPAVRGTAMAARFDP